MPLQHNPVKLFSGSGSLELAEKIAKSYGKPLGEVVLSRFSDGEFQPSYNESIRGNVLVPVIVPKDIDGSKLTALIDERYDFTVAGGMGIYAGRMLRVGIIGEITEREIDLLIEYIKEVLPECKK